MRGASVGTVTLNCRSLCSRNSTINIQSRIIGISVRILTRDKDRRIRCRRGCICRRYCRILINGNICIPIYIQKRIIGCLARDVDIVKSKSSVSGNCTSAVRNIDRTIHDSNIAVSTDIEYILVGTGQSFLIQVNSYLLIYGNSTRERNIVEQSYGLSACSLFNRIFKSFILGRADLCYILTFFNAVCTVGILGGNEAVCTVSVTY